MNKKIEYAVLHLHKNDEIIRQIIADVGECTLKPSEDYFKSLAKSIISQQLATNVAKIIFNRFQAKLKMNITPQHVLNLKKHQFIKAGISKQKRTYLINLAAAFQDGDIEVETITKKTDEEIMEQITKVKGIGRWSVDMFLIFCLNRMNVLPATDKGLGRSVQLHYNLSEPPNQQELMAISEAWKPYRSIAVWYLWQSINKNR